MREEQYNSRPFIYFLYNNKNNKLPCKLNIYTERVKNGN